MNEQCTALLSINSRLYPNCQNILTGLGIHIVNKAPINTKENLLDELENLKPSLALISSNLAGALEIEEVIGKSKQISPGTKLVLITNENDTNKILGYFLTRVNAIFTIEDFESNLEKSLKQILKGEISLCGRSLANLRNSLLNQNLESKLDFALLGLLTDRELEVLYSLTRGINYKQISKELFISESTVKTHVNNIFTKLSVNDRTQAVLYALKHGIEGVIKKPNLINKIIQEQTSSMQ